MLQSGTLQGRLLHRVFENEKFHGETEYLLQAETEGAGPQAFLATQRPNWTLPVHYHRQEQFQVVVDGAGTLGPHPLTSLMVHYASRDAGYGPIVAGPDGLRYLTLRAVGDVGAWYLPEAREQIRRDLPKRQVQAGPWSVSSAPELAGRVEPAVETVIEPAPGGMAGWIVRLGPEQCAPEPLHAGGGGRYLIVVAGDIHLRGRTLPRLACTYASPDEPAVPIGAGAAGAEVLVLQFPASALQWVAS